MGLIDELGFEVASPSPVRTVLGRIAGTWPIPRLFAPILPRLDVVIAKATDGRRSLSSAIGQQVLWVGVRGRRSGQTRQVPLLAFPVGDDLAVIGSNFGRPELPAWVHNLRAHPEVVLKVGERVADALAREATDDEVEEVWRAATRILPSYAGYRRRVTKRPIPVFVFESRPGPDAA